MSYEHILYDIEDGVAIITLNRPEQRNVQSTILLEEVDHAIDCAAGDHNVNVICLFGAGKHFSFGASVEEHLPEQVGTMLARFRELAFAMLDCHVTILAAVRGQCLGGGLEVVTLCHQVMAHADAMFGQPEIVLGVFAPMASIILADRVGQTHAEELCLTGRTVDAGVAHGMGIVNVIDEHPVDAAVPRRRLGQRAFHGGGDPRQVGGDPALEIRPRDGRVDGEIGVLEAQRNTLGARQFGLHA